VSHRLKPSPALVISTVALVIALGGTGYAAFQIPAGSVGNKQLRDGAVTARKVRRHTLLLSDFKPGQFTTSGAVRGPSGPRGPAGPQGLQGPAGSSGPAGSARAFGLVSATGTLDTARSKNVAGVTHPANGIYCISLSGISAAAATIVAMPDEANGGVSGAVAHLDSSAPDCGGVGVALEVEIRRFEYVSSPAGITSFHHDNGFSFVVP
jgi:hypothetical protein